MTPPGRPRPYALFVAARKEEITRKIRDGCRRTGRLPVGLTIDDVVQHALTQLRRHYARMADDDAAVAFAVKTAANFVIDEHRYALARADETWRAAVALTQPVPPSAEQAALARLRRDALAHALRRLPKRQRLAVEFYYAERRSRKDVAAMLNVSEDVAKGLIQRGIANLRHAMKGLCVAPFRPFRRGPAPVMPSRAVLAITLTVSVLPTSSVPIPMPYREAFERPTGVGFDAERPGRENARAAAETPTAASAALAPAPRTIGARAAAGSVGKADVHIGVTAGGRRVGRVGGDELCVHGPAVQEPLSQCANQSVVGMCPLLRRLGLVVDPYTTCKRHSEPVYEPPLP